MSKYLFQNALKHPTFVCPHCFDISSHRWEYVYGPYWRQGQSNQIDPEYTGVEYTFGPEKPTNPFEKGWLQGIIQATCSKCDSTTYWLKSMECDELQVYPMNCANYPQPHKDMPEHIRKTFKEAGSVMHLSLGSSAALSRLTLEKLLVHLEYKNGSLNDKIGQVIKDGEISKRTEKALDVIRVYGNSGAHSGIINLEEQPWVPSTLLKLINLVVDDLITAPKEIDDMYDAMPKGVKNGIKNRDAVKQ
ncbi:DUF4145 domain-containing protein [Bacillus wiedmannii]|uniref:DUF4145 domain-containing protein n=1 Tax=Bacillus wiedmannii TaxID=1890302 RepID=UPI000BF0A2ED|nr:DUF4145 domain-containing protein [Bacillus wiedmannii]PEJ99319.1 hypothetical protein CN690_17385 [Bacillus wiedmannii]